MNYDKIKSINLTVVEEVYT